MKSLVYKNIVIYRVVMNILYSGKYIKRFEDIVETIDPGKEKSIIELCFGDIFIAEWCKQNKVNWLGFDMNDEFVNFALKKGFNAISMNIRLASKFPKADTFVISGSLYHFNDILDEFLLKIMNSCSRLIISEPVNTLTNRSGVIGKIAGQSANAGSGPEDFRFDKEKLINLLNELCHDRWILNEINAKNKDIILDIKWK